MCKCIYAASVKIFTPFRRHFQVSDGYGSAYLCVYLNIFGQHNGLKRLDVAAICGIVIFTRGGSMTEKKRRSEDSRKAAALRQHGSLNPRPGGVGNDLFRTYDFFDPNDLVQVKYEMLRQVSVERGSVTEAAAQFGLSRPSFYEAQSSFQQDGLVGLLPEKRGPRRAHKLSAEIMEFLQKEKAEDPDLSGAALAEKLWKERRLRVHRRSIERALARREKKLPLPTAGRS
jgi:transposase